MPGVVAAVAGILSRCEINIATMKLYRSVKGGEAIMVLETDQPVNEGVSEDIGLIRGVRQAVVIQAMVSV